MPVKKPSVTIFYQFNPSRSSIGGIQSLIGSFIKFASAEFEVRLVGTGVPGESTPYVWQDLEWQGRAFRFLPVMNLANDDRRGKIPTSVRYTHALLKYREPSDFYHFHRLEYAIAARRWQGHKTLFVHNDLAAQLDRRVAAKSNLWQSAPWLYQKLEAVLLPQFQQIFSCNSQSLQRYQKQFSHLKAKLEFFHNAIDPDRYYPLPPHEKATVKQQLAAQWNIPAESRWLLFAGRLHPQKDPVLLLQAFAALNDPNVHLIIAGDGELLPYLAADASAMKLQNRVSFLGPLGQSEVVKFQQTADFVVLTSAYEGLPMVVLEALACGTPILTTDCGETPHIIKAASGRVACHRTIPAVRDLLQASLRDRAQFSVEACVQAACPYSARIVIDQVYQTLWSHWQSQTAAGTTDRGRSSIYSPSQPRTL
jgi:glycosyltransferase involved in cell wall biosynthesis